MWAGLRKRNDKTSAELYLKFNRGNIKYITSVPAKKTAKFNPMKASMHAHSLAKHTHQNT